MARITTPEDLRALYGEPGRIAQAKELHRLDRHAKAFLAQSPFVMIGSGAPGALPDVSPKGGAPGFAVALDDTRILIPDRPGNRRLDTLQNVLVDPTVGLCFLVPGMDETLRVNGTAEIRTDAEWLDLCSHEGKRPISVLLVHVAQVYFHCAKAFLRSRLWDPDRYVDRSSMPSLGTILKDQIGSATPSAVIDERIDAGYRTSLY